MSKKRVVIGLLVAIVVVVAVGIKILTSPASGEVEQKGQAPKQAAVKSAPSTKAYSDDYVGFKMPATYSQIKVTDAGAGYLDALRFVGPDYKSSLLAVSVFASGSTATDSGVDMRQRDNKYTQKPLNLKGAQGYEFIKKTDSEYEISAFVNHGNHLVTIALSDPNGQDLSADFQTILNDWQWRK